MKSQSTVPDTCRAIPVLLLGWLNNELRKLSQRSIREKEGSFTWLAQQTYFDLGEKIAVGNLFASKPDSKYYYAARELCEAAARGEEIVLKLPSTQSKSVFLGQPGEKLSLDVELYEVIKYNGNFGLTFIHKIRDVDGNELVWFSQGKRIDEGIYHLTAKVHTKPEKAYVEYYGTKQTRITHAKFSSRRLVDGSQGRNGVSDAG
jgi:hypothetical protein